MADDGADARRQECVGGHVWSNQFGDDWTPEDSMRCDCGAKTWAESKQAALDARRVAPLDPLPAFLALDRYAILRRASDPEPVQAVNCCTGNQEIIDAEVWQWVKWADVLALIDAAREAQRIPAPPAEKESHERDATVTEAGFTDHRIVACADSAGVTEDQRAADRNDVAGIDPHD